MRPALTGPEREQAMSQDIVRYEVSDWIAEITLNRAPVNALSLQLIDALLDALKKAKSDPAVRAVIIASAHKSILRRTGHRHRSREIRPGGKGFSGAPLFRAQ